MTRKDYVAIARALSSVRPDTYDDPMLTQWARDINAVAATLAADNPRFDRDRFVRACAGGPQL